MMACSACEPAPNAEANPDSDDEGAELPSERDEARDASRARDARSAEANDERAGGRDAAIADADVEASAEPSGPPARAADAARPADATALYDAGRDAPTDAGPSAFVLVPIDFPMYNDELTFPEAANPPTNASPAFEWKGVPEGAKSLALVFRDLGNGAVKWVLWDVPPTLTRVPPNLSRTAMPREVLGSSQLGSLDKQGYAGPGSGARQYDFKLWALNVERLAVSSRLSTVQIHEEVLPKAAIATTPPILVRNTRNLR